MKKIILTLVAVFSMGFSAFAYDVEEAWSKLENEMTFRTASSAEASQAGFTTLYLSENINPSSQLVRLTQQVISGVDDIYVIGSNSNPSMGMDVSISRQKDGRGYYDVLCYLNMSNRNGDVLVVMYGKATESQLKGLLKLLNR